MVQTLGDAAGGCGRVRNGPRTSRVEIVSTISEPCATYFFTVLCQISLDQLGGAAPRGAPYMYIVLRTFLEDGPVFLFKRVYGIQIRGHIHIYIYIRVWALLFPNGK